MATSPTYNKLVRDKIPELIRENGETCTVKILSDADYLHALKTKLQEELDEYLKAASEADAAEELADMLEVIYSLAKCHNLCREQLEEISAEKREKHGGFNDRIFLMETY